MDLMAGAQVLGNVGEFVGSLVVLATVIYLAIQVRQTRLSVQSSSWQNGVNNIIDWNFRLAEDAELAEVFQRGLSDPDSLTSQEQLRLSLVLASFLQQFHKWYLDNEKGLVEEKAWLGEADSMINVLSMPGGERWWKEFRVPFTPEFRAYVDKRLHGAQGENGSIYRFDDSLSENSNH
jgi:hypothetical protein